VQNSRKLWGVSSSLALFLPEGTTQGLVRIRDIDVDLNSEERIITREECSLLSMEETRTSTVGYLRCEGRPHLHQIVSSRRGREARLSLATEVEFSDEMETCISAGGVLWWSGGGHRVTGDESVIDGGREGLCSR